VPCNWCGAVLFLLPQILEALPTVAVEALACGTPVISSDNPGGLELNDVFGADVEIVPKEHAIALAEAVSARLREPRRTRPSTQRVIEQQFRARAIADRYWRVYASAGATAGGALLQR